MHFQKWLYSFPVSYNILTFLPLLKVNTVISAGFCQYSLGAFRERS